MGEWKLQDAKNKFSAVVDAAIGGEPQHVTRRGKPAVVVVESNEFRRMCQMAEGTVPNYDEADSDAPLDGADQAGLAQDAPNKLGSLVDTAMAGRLQCVTRSDKKTVVVVGAKQYESLIHEIRTNGPTFGEMLLAIPKGGPDDLFERQPVELRDIEF